MLSLALCHHRPLRPPPPPPAPGTAIVPLSSPRPPLRIPPSSPLRRKRSNTFRASMDRRAAVSRFPPLQHRHLMLDLICSVEARLGPRLLPSSVPADVRSFENQAGTSFGAIDIRHGAPGSSVDFILESWLHCKTPNGAIDITSLTGFLNEATDAPHFILELIQGAPTSLIVILDLLPRRDLALHPDYIEEYYQDTKLDTQRQELYKAPQVLPYFSASLYVRSVLSPTAIAININCGADGQNIMEEMLGVRLKTITTEIVRIWLDNCAGNSKQIEEAEKDYMIKRDRVVKSKAIEIDLSANLPRLFGAEVASRVTAEIQKAFGVQTSKAD